jgi:hypothetical protein
MNFLKLIRLLNCKILVISLLATFISPNYAFAFVISSEEDCIGNTYQFNFPKTFSFITGGESFRVYVSNSTLAPDIRIRIVSDPSQADLFLVDSYTNADMAVCISDRIGFGNNVTNITLENTSFNADLKIRASTFESQPDHRLFCSLVDLTKAWPWPFLRSYGSPPKS